MPLYDLLHVRQQIAAGATSAAAEMERCVTAAQSPACQNVFLGTRFDAARTEAADPARATQPLAGLAVSVKDLFDVAGEVSAAGSRILQDALPAAQDCPAVARLRRAGGVLMGRTNMTEFAYSGIGVNPHFGTPANALDRDGARIPGGSSSGAAVSVAAGAAFVALGSDTGGSIRIPAAFNGIVGFKSTAKLVPADGCVPLSTSLDTVSAMTRSVRDAMLVHEILAARRVVRSEAPLPAYRLGLVKNLFLDELDPVVASAFERTLARLRAAGAQVRDITLPQLDELPALRANGGFAAETYAWHRGLIARHADAYDPRVLARIRGGEATLAADYIVMLQARQRWIASVEAALAGFDAVLSPTVPITAPTIAEVAPGEARDARFFQLNNQTLRNTSVVNMLDGCAISIPCQQPGQSGVGLMLWHGALHDDTVLNIAQQAEAALRD